MPTEDDVWRDLRKILPKGHWTRVENPICDPGTPDVNFCIKQSNFPPFALEGWVELKYTERLPLEHPVLATQKIWIRKRCAVGGNVLIVVGLKSQLFIVPGREAPYINDWDLPAFVENSVARAENRRDRDQVCAAFTRAFAWLVD